MLERGNMCKYKEYSYLDERLAVYAQSDFYPFHMPGHKRADIDFANPYQLDVTEIDGFDNLHHAQDLLLQCQQRLGSLYHSKKSYYLVNGSTCGILSAVGAVTKRGDTVIMARNCHKAVYHAVQLFGLHAVYVYPKVMEYGIQGGIDPDDVKASLQEQKNVKAVILTSPTFDGIVSDIGILADMIHRYGAYLIVDEAHGAHFSMDSHFPVSAVQKDADLVIQSLHKTLPSFTQTAVLHVASDRVDDDQIEEMLQVFQTSSPSYLLMAGIDRCVRLLEQSGTQLFQTYTDRLASFYQKCGTLRFLQVLTADDYRMYPVYDLDPSKLVISTASAPIDGYQLYERLLNRYHLQMEMYSAEYVLAMTSIMDTQEGFDRLFEALAEIDLECCGKTDRREEGQAVLNQPFMQNIYAKREKRLDLAEVKQYLTQETILEDCIGQICAEYIYLYPPGIPFVVPGELLTKEVVEIVKECRKRNLNIQGPRDQKCQKIQTVEAFSSVRV